MRTYLRLKQERDAYGDVVMTVQDVERIAAAAVPALRAPVDAAERRVSALTDIVGGLMTAGHAAGHAFWGAATGDALIVFGGERGLVGDLNASIADRVATLPHGRLTGVGTTLARALDERHIAASRTLAWTEPEASDTAMVTAILDAFSGGNRVTLVYPRFRGLAVHDIAADTVLPLAVPPAATDGLPLYLPSARRLLDDAAHRLVSAMVVRARAHARLAEVTARVVAMQEATENAKRILGSYQHAYLKARRNQLTAEQLENFIAHQIA